MLAADMDYSYPLGHEFGVACLVASHDSRWIATASWDNVIIIWSPSSSTVAHEWLAHQGVVYSLAWSPDSRRLASAGEYKTVVVWAISKGVLKAAVLEGHTDAVRTCAWSPDGALIASASKDGTVRVWDGHTYQQRELFSNPSNDPHALRFSPDSRYLAWSFDEDLWIWTPLMGEEPRRLPSHQTSRALALSFDSESRRMATAHGNLGPADPDACVVRVWDVATGATFAVLKGHSMGVTDIAFSPDGRSLLSVSSGDGSARMWDAESGEQTALFDDVDDGFRAEQACWSPDGRYIGIGVYGWIGHRIIGRVRLWRVEDGLCVATVSEHDDSVMRIAFTPDGQFLGSGDNSGIVHIRRLANFM